jgi:hypothetical protein
VSTYISPTTVIRDALSTRWPSLELSIRTSGRFTQLSWVDSPLAPVPADVVEAARPVLSALNDDDPFEPRKAYALVAPSLEHLTLMLVGQWQDSNAGGSTIAPHRLAFDVNHRKFNKRTGPYEVPDPTARMFSQALCAAAKVTAEAYQDDHFTISDYTTLELARVVIAQAESFAHATSYPL